MNGLCWMCRINLIFQVLLLVSGRGRYFYETWGGSRFMGTFNDPNQFAFFIFIMMLVFVGVLTGQFFWDKCCHSKQKKVWWFGGVAFLVLLAVGVYLILPGADFDVSQTDYTLLSRIQQKIWKLANGNIYDLLYDRSAERLVLEPQYLLYGAGEGFFERFIPYEGFEALLSPGVFDVFHVNEIHSSFFDVWFSYGLIPTTFLVYWIGRNVIRCDRAQRAAVLALLAESFTLMNCRQPFFWFIIVMAGMSGKKKNTEYE